MHWMAAPEEPLPRLSNRDTSIIWSPAALTVMYSSILSLPDRALEYRPFSGSGSLRAWTETVAPSL